MGSATRVHKRTKGDMNVYQKIAQDVSLYVSNPCAARFQNSIGDTYVGIVGSMSVYSELPRQDKRPLRGIMEFDWIARVNMANGWWGHYIPVDRQKIRCEFRVPILLVHSEILTIEGIKKLFLVSRAFGTEKFTVSKENSDIIRVNNVLTYET